MPPSPTYTNTRSTSCGTLELWQRAMKLEVVPPAPELTTRTRSRRDLKGSWFRRTSSNHLSE